MSAAQSPGNPPLPSHASVVVIGGGIMGCSTLYHLARLGVRDAVLLERNQLTSGTTWHSAAQVRALRSSYNMTELIRYSIALYRRLEEETGQAAGWINKGSLSLACNPGRLAHIRRQEALARLFGVRARSIPVGEAKERWPLMSTDDVLGVVWSPDDGRVSPSDLCAALIKGAKAAGATIYEQTAVTAIHTKNNKVVALQTTGGDIRCDAAAICAGLWSREVAALAGSEVPLWPCEHFYLLTKPLNGLSGNLPTLSDHDSHLYFRDDSGGLLVGCFEPMGKPLDPARLGNDFAFQLLAEDWEHFEPMVENALARVPALAQAEVKMLLNGPESFTPDGMFMLGETAETAGLFLGCGMNSVGVATGGGAGQALAQCIVQGYLPAALPEIDPKRFPACFNSAAALAARAPEILGRHYEISYPGRQSVTARQLRHPPAYSLWQQRQAHFGQIYGWERPLYFNKTQEPPLTFDRPAWFEQVGNEVQQAHAGIALFDSSTLGKIRVCGADAETFLNRVCTNNMARPPGRVMYTAMLNERGGMESDLTALRLDYETYRLYTGSAAIKRDLAWLRRQRLPNERVQLSDESEDWAVFALAGAQTPAFADSLGVPEWNSLALFRHCDSAVAGIALQVARLSYTGEAGWELTCRRADAAALAAALLAAGAAPAGLYAQTSMRIEKRFVAYGHDVDSDNTPLQAGLGVYWDKDFIGKSALIAAGEQPANDRDRRLISLLAAADAGAVMLGNEPVLLGKHYVGQTTSAAYGYRVQRQVALAWLPRAALESAVQVNVGGHFIKADIIAGAVFDPSGKRMKEAIK